MGSISKDYDIIPVQLAKRLDREIYGFLADLGILEQRTDEFVYQEELVKKFIKAWNKVVEKIEKKVLEQIKKGKTEVKI